MHNLCIDVGNSSAKLAVFKNGELVLREKWKRLEEEPLEEFIRKQGVGRVILSSVGKKDDPLCAYLKERFDFVRLEHDTALPIQNLYATPKTLGKDRIAAVVGAWHLYPNEASLVIDIGTCITYDYLTAEGNYIGGGISPGIRLRYKAMHHFTARLPLVKRRDLEGFVGDSTESCMRVGAQQGTLNEVEGFIRQFKEKYGAINIIITGGDTEYFVSHLKNKIFAVPNLVLVGLNKILDYNVNNF